MIVLPVDPTEEGAIYIARPLPLRYLSMVITCWHEVIEDTPPKRSIRHVSERVEVILKVDEASGKAGSAAEVICVG